MVLKIGIAAKSFGWPLRRGLAEARRLQVAGIELEVAGELAPDKLSQTGRRELRHLLKSHELELTALACPLRHGLDVPLNLERRIEHLCKAQALSHDLGSGIAIVQAGKLPATAEDPRAGVLREALSALAAHGDRTGTTLAIDTGLDDGDALRAFLASFDTGSLGVHFDPANLLVGGFDVYASARALRGRIVHCQARDARRLGPGRAAQEVALGHGQIDWLSLLGTLEEIDYHGWLTIARDTGDNRPADIANGVSFLRRLVR